MLSLLPVDCAWLPLALLLVVALVPVVLFLWLPLYLWRTWLPLPSLVEVVVVAPAPLVEVMVVAPAPLVVGVGTAYSLLRRSRLSPFASLRCARMLGWWRSTDFVEGQADFCEGPAGANGRQNKCKWAQTGRRGDCRETESEGCVSVWKVLHCRH